MFLLPCSLTKCWFANMIVYWILYLYNNEDNMFLAMFYHGQYCILFFLTWTISWNEYSLKTREDFSITKSSIWCPWRYKTIYFPFRLVQTKVCLQWLCNDQYYAIQAWTAQTTDYIAYSYFQMAYRPIYIYGWITYQNTNIVSNVGFSHTR